MRQAPGLFRGIVLTAAKALGLVDAAAVVVEKPSTLR
jgi:hypothetical protein